MTARAPNRPTWNALWGAIAAAALASCAGSDGAELYVAVATSLREPTTEIAALYSDAHPTANIVLSFGASSVLARQIRAGAPIDVFVSADARLPAALADDGLVDSTHSAAIARNQLVVIVTPTLLGVISKPSDLDRVEVRRLALPELSVPVGHYARQWLGDVGMLERISDRIFRTDHALATLRSVDAGYADAAIVYATDARLAKSARIAFEIPDAQQPEIVYVAAATTGSRSPTQAADFVSFLRDPQARSVLVRAGFREPRSATAQNSDSPQ